MVVRLSSALVATLIFVFAGVRLTAAPAVSVTPVADGAHRHYGYETQIADLTTQNAMLWGTVDFFSISTEVGGIIETPTPFQALPSPTPRTFTPSPPPTWTATPTRTPSATNTAAGQSPTPSLEEPGATRTALTLVPTFPTDTPAPTTPTITPAISLTPSLTFTATTDPAWINGCAPDGDFEPHEGFRINTRTRPSLNAERLDLVTHGDILIICSGSMRVVDGYTWIQVVSAVQEEWLVIRQGDETWGVLTVWPE